MTLEKQVGSQEVIISYLLFQSCVARVLPQQISFQH